MEESGSEIRRPIAARSSSWARALAKGCAKAGLTPNTVSLIGLLLAIIASALITFGSAKPLAEKVLYWLPAALFIPLRLICNMLDGLMAVEENLGTKVGIMFNEIPDRVEDSLLLISAGFACNIQNMGSNLGWTAALLAVMTAYIRAFGGSLGLAQDFCGPMAKPHRMFWLTVGVLTTLVEQSLCGSQYALLVSLVVIVLGSLLTCLKRILRIAALLNAR